MTAVNGTENAVVQNGDGINGNNHATDDSHSSNIPQNTLSITDNRTGRNYVVEISHNSIPATAFKEIRAPENPGAPEDQNENGIRVYDPGFVNTAVKTSQITYIDGHKGLLLYRGIPLSELAGKKKFEDISFLLIWGHLPSPEERANYSKDLASVPLPSKTVFDVIQSFDPAAPILSMIVAGLAAVQASNPQAIPAIMGKNLYMGNLAAVDREAVKLLANLAAVSAIAYCHHTRRRFTPPLPGQSFVERLFTMIGHVERETGLPNPKHVAHIEKLWSLVADHELTNSTSQFLGAASSLSDIVACQISAVSASHGILHAGAIEVAYKSIAEVGSVENAQAKIDSVKAGKERLFGYGHRVYKVTDPRSIYIREVMEELGKEKSNQDPILEISLELDRIASRDEYFVKRNLKANADLWASFAYMGMGFPAEFVHPLSIIARTQGLVAHFREAMDSTAPRIWRPQQIYVGKLFTS